MTISKLLNNEGRLLVIPVQNADLTELLHPAQGRVQPARDAIHLAQIQ